MAKKTTNFTQRIVQSIQPPTHGREIYYDSKIKGLCLRVSSTGRKTWQVYKWHDGRPLRITLGTFPALSVEHARTQALAILNKLAKGENPNEKKTVLKFGELFNIFLERHQRISERTRHDYQELYELYIKKPLGNKPINRINRKTIAALHARIGKEKPIRANRVLATISTVFGRAIEWGLADPPNPCIGIKRFPEKSRDRFLKADELPRFFKALNEEPNETIRDFFWILLLTGARRSNVLSMRWQDIDWNTKTWRIPKTKNQEPQVVPLVPEAIDILRARYEAQKQTKLASIYVFPGRGKTGHLVEPKAAWKRILKRAGLEDLRIHDLRRTLGSWQAIMGTPLPIIGKSLGHKSSQATEVYSRLELDPVREAMQKATSTILKLAHDTNE